MSIKKNIISLKIWLQMMIHVVRRLAFEAQCNDSCVGACTSTHQTPRQHRKCVEMERETRKKRVENNHISVSILIQFMETIRIGLTETDAQLTD